MRDCPPKAGLGDYWEEEEPAWRSASGAGEADGNIEEPQSCSSLNWPRGGGVSDWGEIAFGRRARRREREGEDGS